MTENIITSTTTVTMLNDMETAIEIHESDVCDGTLKKDINSFVFLHADPRITLYDAYQLSDKIFELFAPFKEG